MERKTYIKRKEVNGKVFSVGIEGENLIPEEVDKFLEVRLSAMIQIDQAKAIQGPKADQCIKGENVATILDKPILDDNETKPVEINVEAKSIGDKIFFGLFLVAYSITSWGIIELIRLYLKI